MKRLAAYGGATVVFIYLIGVLSNCVAATTYFERNIVTGYPSSPCISEFDAMRCNFEEQHDQYPVSYFRVAIGIPFYVTLRCDFFDGPDRGDSFLAHGFAVFGVWSGIENVDV